MSHPRIQSDPKIMFGKPVIRGTRITAEHILRCLAAGESADEIVANYPPLTLQDIRAAQGFRLLDGGFPTPFTSFMPT